MSDDNRGWVAFFVAALIVAACVLMLCGCSGNDIKTEGLSEAVDGRFECGRDMAFTTVVDTDTGVIYLVYRDGPGNAATGGITPLLNRDGLPVIDPRYE